VHPVNIEIQRIKIKELSRKSEYKNKKKGKEPDSLGYERKRQNKPFGEFGFR